MAEPDNKPALASENEAAVANGGRSKLTGRLIIAGFVGSVIVIQLVLAMVFMSSIAKTAQSDVASVQQQVEQEIEKDSGLPADSSAPTVEVELGDFAVTSYQPSSETALRIDFHLFATVAEDSQNQFLDLLERNKNRIREQVIVTMRNAELTDLTDPGLGLIKRRILTKVNRTLGKPLLRTIIISDFSFVEQ